ncbi:MAG: tRNA (adenosine(37)-N6)-threonylcarbamoyltransferase complex transferase subunit TsaD [Candidatus Levybacteria bacterium]|nr:tRNA (adenosine(37)-N6)-threonylcarbamoyltransferase complex transferase subunit TsaD [Candidatus Levybacteria bacterium]
MKILAIETSCDETAAAIVSKNPQEDYVKILSNVVASSLIYHSQTGGIIPDIAAREQLKFIIPVIEKTIEDSKLRIEDLDAIAVTYGPGLIGSLLIGVETAKTLAYLWNKPIMPINHLLGHIYANFVNEKSKIEFPAIALLVSGGHTDLVFLKNHKRVKWIGGTLDDAAGEAFDKIGRLLGLPYPGGPAIEQASEHGIAGRFTFPRPMIGSHDFNFSFSGLKAAVFREVTSIRHPERSEGSHALKRSVDSLPKAQNDIDKQQIADIASSVQNSIVQVLVRKTVKAAKKYNAKSILLGGGVAANQKLKEEMHSQLSTLNFQLHVPPAHLCTDNAVMIGAYAAFNYKPQNLNTITANPELYFQ